MRRRSASPSKNERREPIYSEYDIRVSERSEDGCPCRSEDDPTFSHPTILKVQREPALSAAVLGQHNRIGSVLSVSISGCPSITRTGAPVGARIILTLNSFLL